MYAAPAQEDSRQVRGEFLDATLVNTKNRGTLQLEEVAGLTRTVARNTLLSSSCPSIFSPYVMYLAQGATHQACVRRYQGSHPPPPTTPVLPAVMSFAPPRRPSLASTNDGCNSSSSGS